jgi:hypothetical protein
MPARPALLRWLLVLALVALTRATPTAAQDRRVEVHYHPTLRAQIAIWIESADGERFRTLLLTDSVAYRGIGNRPGATQMNSAFHWPYGRREGVLPVWAHRRYDASGVAFPRVVFAGRVSEGNASSAGSPSEIVNTRDDYYCLSFTPGDESLDAMTCASVFMSNKGRYMTAADVGAGYGEPWQDRGASRMRALTLESLYPPRQDLTCGDGCRDHDDVRRFVTDAQAVMPELDAVATPTPDSRAAFLDFVVPEDWPDGDYVVYVEVNTEGDHAPGWDTATYPTPREPTGSWDIWAVTYGYPYRGQPSVVYRLPIRIDATGGEWSTATPAGFGDLHGLDGDIHEMDGTIRDDPDRHPGSGADRLLADEEGRRLRALVPTVDVCAQPEPPPQCGAGCGPERPCDAPLVCGADATCVDRCEVQGAPAAPVELTLSRYEERQHAHQWAHLAFRVPASARGIRRYEVRVSTSPITDEASFEAARPAKQASVEDLALVIDPGAAEGELVEVDLGGLLPETVHHVGVRAYDDCVSPGPIATASIETPPIQFTTVSPCFVATAAYGDPLDARIGALRRFRDRHLLPSALGRALVSVYETVGPVAARAIEGDEDRRVLARAVLEPVVSLIERLER